MCVFRPSDPCPCILKTVFITLQQINLPDYPCKAVHVCCARIYSKFHAKRVQELLEGGLYNLTCLLLTLALTADLHDVVRSQHENRDNSVVT